MAFGFLTGLVLIFAIVCHNWQRSRVSEVKDLIPNILLTTHPIVFVTGKRSLFYFLGYWNQIPHWLASHGYEVFHFSLPWKNSDHRLRVMRRFLEMKTNADEKIHLFIDESSFDEIKALLEESDFKCLCSVTLVGQSKVFETALSPRLSLPIEEIQIPDEGARSRPFFWLLHQAWTAQTASLVQLGWNLTPHQGQVLLQRTQFLAERDLLQGQSSPNLKS